MQCAAPPSHLCGSRQTRWCLPGAPDRMLSAGQRATQPPPALHRRRARQWPPCRGQTCGEWGGGSCMQCCCQYRLARAAVPWSGMHAAMLTAAPSLQQAGVRQQLHPSHAYRAQQGTPAHLTASTGSHCSRLSGSAPNLAASASRSGTESMANTHAAPISRAPAVGQGCRGMVEHGTEPQWQRGRVS